MGLRAFSVGRPKVEVGKSWANGDKWVTLGNTTRLVDWHKMMTAHNSVADWVGVLLFSLGFSGGLLGQFWIG